MGVSQMGSQLRGDLDTFSDSYPRRCFQLITTHKRKISFDSMAPLEVLRIMLFQGIFFFFVLFKSLFVYTGKFSDTLLCQGFFVKFNINSPFLIWLLGFGYYRIPVCQNICYGPCPGIFSYVRLSFSIPVCFFPFYYIIFLYRPIYFLREAKES